MDGSEHIDLTYAVGRSQRRRFSNGRNRLPRPDTAPSALPQAVHSCHNIRLRDDDRSPAIRRVD